MSTEPLVTKQTVVEQLLADLERGSGDLPILPLAAANALRLAQAPDVDRAEVVRVAEADPPLAARFLGVANSALYFSGEPVGSIEGAITRLGVQATRDVLYMAAYSGTIFEVPQYQTLVEASFRHSVVVARLARRIASACGRNPESAFVAGLLHDLGRVRCLKLAALRTSADPFADEVVAAIDQLHAVAGGKLARSWNLPDEIVQACERHHHPGGHPMATVIGLADGVANAAATAAPEDLADGAALAAVIGLDPNAVASLLQAAIEERDELRRDGS